MSDTETRSGEFPGAPDIGRMSIPELIGWITQHGHPADPRADIDTAALRRRFPRLAHVQTADEAIPGAHGTVDVRVYRDATAEPAGTALVWAHGGAFIGGDLDMPESNWVARELAAQGIPVVSVDYAKCLGGVHYPVPSDDVRTAWRWARSVADSLLGVRPEALVLGGASAGGALAAGVVTRLRDAGEPLPAGLVLAYPVLHPNSPAASADISSSSPHTQFATNFAGSDEALSNPQAFAGLDDGHGFPATSIVVCEHDELRPSGESFARVLTAAGVDVELRVESGAPHGHLDLPGDEGALRTIDAIARWMLRRPTSS